MLKGLRVQAVKRLLCELDDRNYGKKEVARPKAVVGDR
jgi:hypothetical protein